MKGFRSSGNGDVEDSAVVVPLLEAECDCEGCALPSGGMGLTTNGSLSGVVLNLMRSLTREESRTWSPVKELSYTEQSG
jgi:hypothetical protein